MKQTFTYKGKIYVVELTSYSSNDATALLVYRKGHKADYEIITVNLPDSPYHSDGFVYIDTNNCSWAEDFLTTTGLGQKTDCTCRSVFCSYPLYHINLGLFK